MDTRVRLSLLTAGLLLASGETFAQNADSLPPGVTPIMIESGRKVYGGPGLCTACHGPTGTGTVGANLTDAEWVHGDGSYDAIVRTVLSGVPAAKSRKGVPMPPRGGARLTDEQVQAVAAYVWSFRSGAAGR